MGPIVVMNGKIGVATRAPQYPKRSGGGFWNTVFTEVKNYGQAARIWLNLCNFLKSRLDD